MTRMIVPTALSAALLLGCAATPGVPGGGGGGSPSVLPTPSPTPMPTPAPASRLVMDFDAEPLGALSATSPWIDVYQELTAQGLVPPTWMYRGAWEIADVATPQRTSRMLRQTKVQERPPITLLRFRGDFYGLKNGALPPHYRMEVTQQPMRSPYNLPPTGDQGIQPYYRDANHYLEVVTTPKELQFWSCDGALPDSATGWQKLWSRPLVTRPGDLRRVGAIVDVPRGRIEVLYNGQVEATFEHQALLDATVPPQASLRAIGNEVNFDDVEFERLP